MIPVINKPTWVYKETATDYIITNSLLHRTIDTGIIRLDILDNFPIFLPVEIGKRNLLIIQCQNIWSSIIGTSLIKKTLPIALMNNLLELD